MFSSVLKIISFLFPLFLKVLYNGYSGDIMDTIHFDFLAPFPELFPKWVP